MCNRHKHIFRDIVTVLAVAMFFSCGSNFEDVRKLNVQERFPVGIAEDYRLIYTDSAKIKVALTSPISKDFSNQEFPFQEFPEGLQVEFYDDEKNKSTVTADYGIIYQATKMADLQGNVVVHTHDGKKLETPQLYWDQLNKWVFTSERFTYTNPEDGTLMNGTGIEFSQDFEEGQRYIKAYHVDGYRDVNMEEEENGSGAQQADSIREQSGT
ncbi:LPS export ABC transporter periplasmic protein LptC [Sinomicrobium soli]|uniref:LPS export ABC transporter periplasmic protein LptC n=1 Tax=Sinomicrobium sp. N-1-3-6 TaxID=2219864 RepID=UPI000DCB5630|nr:LPS export ABC transporter periplasmic protein LptC [Sinomicrobium sp. N-1-3-6]RAV29739.1 LPS export ABC transporter periplasmic protein LptC [Sinomicrobium sp. N-1-3-6]